MSRARVNHQDAEVVVFAGDAVSAARSLARAFGRIGYGTLVAASKRRTGLDARPSAAVVIAAAEGVDPFRVVASVRARLGFAHAFVFVWTTPVIGADSTPLDDAIERIAGRVARARTLCDGATVLWDDATSSTTGASVAPPSR